MAGQHIAVGHLIFFLIIFLIPVLVNAVDCGGSNASDDGGANKAGDRDHNRIYPLLPLLHQVEFGRGRAEESWCILRIPEVISAYSL